MDDSKELWKDVEGYEGRYQVSSLGRVRSIVRTIIRKDGMKVLLHGNILTQQRTHKGYLRAALCNDGICTMYQVHRLVASAFIPNIEHKPEVNHKDGNKENNAVSNLEWVTSKENRDHALATGLRKKSYESKKKKRVCSYDSKWNLVSQYDSLQEAADDISSWTTNISRSCTSHYKTKGLYWRYADDGEERFEKYSAQQSLFHD